MITLVLADDHQAFAEGLGMVLNAEDDIEIVGVARDGHEALALIGSLTPTVLLLDAHMPNTNLTQVLRDAKIKAPQTKVMVLSADTRRETIAAATQAGADGFLAKDTSGRQVASIVRRLVGGEGGYFTPAGSARPPRDPSVELRVRTLSARGYSNRRIAEECFLSLNTVRTHVQNVLVKLGVHSKLEAVAFALEHQVVPTGPGGAPAPWPDDGDAP